MNITFKGTPIMLVGLFPKNGEKAPDFTLVKNDMSEFSLQEEKGHYLILNIFPSLDTGVCANTVRRFNQLAASLPNTRVLCISKDLPFAQKRFCVAEGIDRVIPLSDFRPTSHFGEKYGVLIANGPMQGLLARAVIIISPERKVMYAKLVSEVTDEPNYEEVLKVINLSLASKDVNQ